MTTSLSSVANDSSQQDQDEGVDSSPAAPQDVVDYDSIKTAKNLSRIFSLEEKLKLELAQTQDDFYKRIPYLLMEVRIIDEMVC